MGNATSPASAATVEEVPASEEMLSSVELEFVADEVPEPLFVHPVSAAAVEKSREKKS